MSICDYCGWCGVDEHDCRGRLYDQVCRLLWHRAAAEDLLKRACTALNLRGGWDCGEDHVEAQAVERGIGSNGAQVYLDMRRFLRGDA